VQCAKRKVQSVKPIALCPELNIEDTLLRRLSIPIALAAVLLIGCEDTFSPKAPYQERIVVFSVLDPSAPYQVVRLESTYDAELSSPDDPVAQREITEAEVEVTGDDDRFVFRDTLITLGDGSQKKVWVNYDLEPSEGTAYTLKVNVPGFEEITARTTVPSRSYVRLQTMLGGVRMAAVENTAYPPSAWYFRMWIVGTKIEGGQEVEVRREVPVRYDEEAGQWLYTDPSRQTSVVFSSFNMERTWSELRSIDGVPGTEVVGTAYSLDVYVYSYYKLVRGFDDPVSVRQDRPDISNVRNGVGIFGAIYPDSARARYSSLINQ